MQAPLAEILLEMDKSDGLTSSKPKPTGTPEVGPSQTPTESSQHTIAPLMSSNRVKGTKKILLLINIIVYDKNGSGEVVLPRRDGTERDVVNLVTTFLRLGYRIFPKNPQRQYYGKDDIERVIREFKEECDRVQPESCVIFIGTHGSEDTIWTSDLQQIPYTRLFMQFYHDRFPVMANKPKLILLQACRNGANFGNNLDAFDADDGDAFAPLPVLNLESLDCDDEDAFHPAMVFNLIVVHAQVPALVAARNAVYGSRLVIAVCELLANYAGSLNIRDFLTRVQEHVEKNNLLHHDGEICELRYLGSCRNFLL